MPKAKQTYAPSDEAGRVWFAACSLCAWTLSRSNEDEVRAAADAHALKHEPTTTTRPSW
jgi:hypothetical protein